MLVDRAATFRGKAVDYGVSASSGGFPQFVLSLVATEIYDAEEQKWVDWSEYDVNEITAYCILFGSKGETLTFNQVKKVFNWDGADFQTLSEGDYSEVGIQFRVEEDTYEQKTRLKVVWIDEFDAEPGRSVKKLGADELKQLTAKYAQFLKAKPAVPAKAPAKSPGKVKAKGVKPTSPKGPVKKVTKKTATQAQAETKPDPDVSTPPPGDPPLAPPAPVASAGEVVGSCTKQEAWDEVVGLRKENVDDQKLAETWQGAIKAVHGNPKQDELNDEEWLLVKEKVNETTAQF